MITYINILTPFSQTSCSKKPRSPLTPTVTLFCFPAVYLIPLGPKLKEIPDLLMFMYTPGKILVRFQKRSPMVCFLVVVQVGYPLHGTDRFFQQALVGVEPLCQVK